MTSDPAGGNFSVVNFLFDPGSQFAKLAARPRFAAPVVVLTAGTFALSVAYYSRLDYGWFAEHLVATHPLVARLGHGGGLPLSREVLMWPAILSAATSVPLLWLVTSLYVLFAAAAMRRPLGLKQALALTAWAGVPCIVALLPSALNLALHGDGRLAPEQIDPTTFGALFGLQDVPVLHALSMRIGPASLWAWALLSTGLRVVLALRWGAAVALVAAPVVLVFGGLAAVAALAGS